MKKIILVRHGDYQTDELTHPGKKQIEKIAKLISQYCADKRVIILTSKAKRAIDSGEIFQSAFNCRLEIHEILYSSNNNDVPRIITLIETKFDDFDTIIIITHLAMMGYLPSVCAETFFDTVPFSSIPHPNHIEKGHALVIADETMQHLK